MNIPTQNRQYETVYLRGLVEMPENDEISYKILSDNEIENDSSDFSDSVRSNSSVLLSDESAFPKYDCRKIYDFVPGANYPDDVLPVIESLSCDEPEPGLKTKEYTVTVPTTGDYRFTWNLLFGTGTATIYDPGNGHPEWAGELKGDATFNKVRLYKGVYRIVLTYSSKDTEPEGAVSIKPYGERIIYDFGDLAWDMTQALEPYLLGVVLLPDFNDSRSKGIAKVGWSKVQVKTDVITSGYKLRFTGKGFLDISGWKFEVDITQDKFCDVYLSSDFSYQDFDINASFSATVRSFDEKRSNLSLGFLGKVRSASLTVSVNTINDDYKFAGSIEIQTPGSIGRNNVTPFSCSFEIKSGEWDGVSISVQNANYLLMPVYQLYLQDVNISATGFSQGDRELNGSVKFSILKTITVKGVSWLGIEDGQYSIIELSGQVGWGVDSGDFSIKANLEVLGGVITGEGNIEYKDRRLSGSISAKLAISDFLSLDGRLSISSKAVTVSLSGTFKAPSSWWFVGGKEATGSITIQVGLNGSPTYLLARGSIGGLSKEYRYNFVTGDEERRGDIQLEEVSASRSTVLSTSEKMFEKTYCLETTLTGQDLIFVNTFSLPTSDVDWAITNSLGEIYTSSDLHKANNLYVSGDVNSTLKIGIRDAAAGNWTIRFTGESPLQQNAITTVAGITDRTVDKLELDVKESRIAEVEFSLALETQYDDLTLSLYYDDDNSGYDGFYAGDVTPGADGSFIWDLPEELQTGDLYFYVMAAGDECMTVFSDYTDSVSIQPANDLISAENLQICKNCYDSDNIISLEWDFVNLGNSESGDFYSRIVLSEDMEFDADDAIITTVWHSTMAGGERDRDSSRLLISDDYSSGRYYIGIVTNFQQEKESISYDYDGITWVEFNAEVPHTSSNYGQLLTSSTWNQSSPWNDCAPLLSPEAESRMVAGCGPIAAAQILYALQAPSSLSFDSSDSYTKSGISFDGSHESLKFPSFAELNTALSNLKFDGSPEEMAMLAFAVGVKLQASYTATATSSYIPETFFTEDCGFDSAHRISMTGIKNSDGTIKQEYIDVIAENIQQGSPVLLTIPNHFVFIEDYDRLSNQFYINYGWGGKNDGWYDLHDINGDSVTAIMLDIIPEYSGDPIIVNSTADYGVGTLRRAVELANSIKGCNTIIIDPSLAGQTITLNSRLEITDQVHIVGLDSREITISRNFRDYLFFFSSDSKGSTVSGITLNGGGNSSEQVWSGSAETVYSNVAFTNITGKYAIYSSSAANAVRFDSTCELNGCSTYRPVIYIPDQVSGGYAEFVSDENILFSWNATEDVEDGIVSRYLLEYSLSPSFSDIISITVSGLSYLLDNVTKGINYFWRVCGIDSSGNEGILGEIQRLFTGIDVTAPAQVTGLQTELDDIRANLTWNVASDAGSGVAHYILEYAENADFSDATEIVTESTIYKLAGLKNNATYFWRVAAVDYEGNRGAFSQTVTFAPSADFLILANVSGQTVSTDRKLHITAGGGCVIDDADSSESTTSSILVRLQGYETQFYLDGDLSLKNGHGWGYGIYGNNIIDGNIGGTITLESDYENPQEQSRAIYGMCVNNLEIREFSSRLSLTGRNKVSGYGIYARDAYMHIEDFLGTITIQSNLNAQAIRSTRDFSIETFAADASIVVETENSSSYGIYNYTYDAGDHSLNGFVTMNELAGEITVSSRTGSATGIYNCLYNGGNSAMSSRISINDLSGTMTVTAQGNAYGICSSSSVAQNVTGSVSERIEITVLSGNLAISGDSGAIGITARSGTVAIADLSGVLTVSSENSYAYGIRSKSEQDIFISGTLLANSSQNGQGVYCPGGLKATISGMVVATKYLVDGENYAVSAGVLKQKLDAYRSNPENYSIAELENASRGYSFYCPGENDDTIEFKASALVSGDIYFDRGNDTLILASGSEYYGSINTRGKLEVIFSVLRQSDKAMLNTASLSVFQSSNTNLSVVVSKNYEGKQILLKTTDSRLWGNKQITLQVGDTRQEVAIGSRAVTIDNLTLKLSWEDSSQLVLTCENANLPEIPGAHTSLTGNFSDRGGMIRFEKDETITLHCNGEIKTLGKLSTSQWIMLSAGDFNRDGKDGLLWLEKATGNVYMQNDLSSMAEVTNKSNLLGVAGGGYEVRAVGDFFGTGFAGALLLSPAFGDSTVSLNYGLATWSREQDGSTTPGWLGALVNTWEESGALNVLKGDFQNLTGDERNKVINANNYRYELVGVGDFNGDGIDDVMLRNTMPDTVGGETITGAGDVFVFLTDTRENVIAGNRPAEGIVYTGCVTGGWNVIGIGDFNGDGVDDVLVSNGIDLAGWQISNGQRTGDLWFGSLADGWKFAGVGDFDADGTDDILLADPDNNLAAWKVKDGKAVGIITIV